MLERNVVPDKVTCNTVFDGYCKVGDLDEAFRIRDKMKCCNVEVNVVTFNTLLKGLCRGKKMDEAKNVWEDMKVHVSVLDVLSYSFMFDRFSRSGDLDAIVSFYEEMDKDVVRTNEYLSSGILFNGSCKGWMTNKAQEILINYLTQDSFQLS